MAENPYMEMVLEIYPMGTGSADWRFSLQPNADHGEGVDICYQEWDSEDKKWVPKSRVGSFSPAEMRLLSKALLKLADYYEKERGV